VLGINGVYICLITFLGTFLLRTARRLPRRASSVDQLQTRSHGRRDARFNDRREMPSSTRVEERTPLRSSVQLFPAAGITWGNAAYMAIITFTTVGLGDFSPPFIYHDTTYVDVCLQCQGCV